MAPVGSHGRAAVRPDRAHHHAPCPAGSPPQGPHAPACGGAPLAASTSNPFAGASASGALMSRRLGASRGRRRVAPDDASWRWVVRVALSAAGLFCECRNVGQGCTLNIRRAEPVRGDQGGADSKMDRDWGGKGCRGSGLQTVKLQQSSGWARRAPPLCRTRRAWRQGQAREARGWGLGFRVFGQPSPKERVRDAFASLAGSRHPSRPPGWSSTLTPSRGRSSHTICKGAVPRAGRNQCCGPGGRAREARGCNLPREGGPPWHEASLESASLVRHVTPLQAGARTRETVLQEQARETRGGIRRLMLSLF